MKMIIDKKVYDTETSKLIASYSNGLSYGDFNRVSEELYVTKNGQYFLHARGGALSIYSEGNGKNSWGISKIILMDKNEVYDWLEKHNFADIIEEIFEGEIQEG